MTDYFDNDNNNYTEEELEDLEDLEDENEEPASSIATLDENVWQLEKYKKIYGEIYTITLDDVTFIFREVTHEEFNKLIWYFKDEDIRDEMLCKLCVLYPEKFDYVNCSGNITTNLINEILYESGITVGNKKSNKLNKLLKEYRALSTSFDYYIYAIITEAFPHITPEEIDTWTCEKTMRYFVLSEYKLTNLRGINMQVVDLEEEEKKKQKQGKGNKKFKQQRPEYEDFPELRGID